MLFLRKFSAAARLFKWPTDKAGVPLNAFLAYVKEERPKMREHPEHRFKRSREREALISLNWKEMDPEEKRKRLEGYRVAKSEFTNKMKG